MKRVFIIHGWGGYPDEGWLPWLRNGLIKIGVDASTPKMPVPKRPEINSWVSFLRKTVGEVDEKTYFVGHSIGCQTILRYLESLPKNKKIGGVVFVAGWTHLTDAAYEDEEDPKIAKPWLDTPIDWKKIKIHTKKFIAIFSDNDPLVPMGDSKIFEKYLGAKIIIEHEKGHFSGSDGVTELPVVLNALLGLMKKN